MITVEAPETPPLSRGPQWARAIAWSLVVLATSLMIAGSVLSLIAGSGFDFFWLFMWAYMVVFALVGVLIALRHSRNAIGWIFLGAAVTVGFGILAGSYADYWLETDEGPAFLDRSAAMYSNLSWMPWILVPSTFLVLLFPDGRLLSPRWRPFAWCAGLGIAGGFVVEGMRPGPIADYPQVDNPYGVHSALLDPLNGFTLLLVFVGLGAAAVSMVKRFRRASGQERQQIKWLAFAAAVAAVVIPTGFAVYEVVGDHVADMAMMLSVLGLPLAAGVAILKFRLYDIDVVISRTLLVAGLVGFITAAYVGIVVGVGSLLGGGGGEPNVVLSVVATTVVAVLFQPVRRWLQRLANRVVFGRRSTPYDVLSGFAVRVGAGESSPESLVHLAELVAGGTGADPARVWLRVGSVLRVEASWPVGSEVVDAVEIDVAGDVDAAVGLLPGTDLSVPVVERGELLGVLTIVKPRGERVTEVDTDLVERLAAASGVVLRNLRLDAELGQRLEQLEASRWRLVSAQDDARRRIEADLAGGSRAELELLRERLTVLAGQVDAAAAPKTAMLLGQLVDATDGALGTLAGLAAGVYPPQLAADGLVVALTEQATKAALPVRIDADDVGRYEPEVEAAVYFAVLEGLQNVAKYANATTAQVHLSGLDGQLTFTVTDDGDGFDTTTTTLGTGLQGLVDRLDTVDGTLTITSTPGTGTTLTGHISISAAAPEYSTRLIGAAI